MKQDADRKRACGILLPVFSLPSKYGIGTFSKEAYRFVDFLQAAGQTYWQALPMGPTGYADSPYQSFSTYAGNPYFIDPDELIEEGLLDKTSVAKADFGSDATRIDYGALYRNRLTLLREAYERGRNDALTMRDYRAYVRKNADWLADYALFMVLKNTHEGRSWDTWEEPLRKRTRSALMQYRRNYADEIAFHCFLQFLFDRQWRRLKAYANERGVKLIGDLPIYVAYDSADAWANPELFYFDEDRRPIEVAGCPPDDYAVTGQLWGNPLYRWDVHEKTKYAWWMRRVSHATTLYDVVRIDHFRGFESYYAIKAKAKTAEHGKWKKGPGYALFQAMEKQLGKQNLIAENLGFLTPAVHELLEKTGFPGMKVLHFAFYADEKGRYDSEYLPHRYDRNCVVYTGTHDNDTTVGWFSSLKKKDQTFLLRYLGLSGQKIAASKLPQAVAKELIRLALMSVADTAIIPMQDYLALNGDARINTPSTIGDNWLWRMKRGDASKALAKQIKDLAATYGRINL